MAKLTRIVKCPHCKTVVAWLASNQFKPFCSERCRAIDFGEWVMEKKLIPGVPVIDALDFEPFDSDIATDSSD